MGLLDAIGALGDGETLTVSRRGGALLVNGVEVDAEVVGADGVVDDGRYYVASTASAALARAVATDNAALARRALASGADFSLRKLSRIDPTSSVGAAALAARGAELATDLLYHADWSAISIDRVKYLVDRGAQFESGYNETCKAIMYGRSFDFIEALLALGAGPESALYYAASHPDGAQLVELLLSHGADVHASGDALRMCAARGNVDAARALLRAGADVHERQDGALAEAIDRGQADMINLLLDAGADLHARGGRILENASCRVVALLLARGARPRYFSMKSIVIHAKYTNCYDDGARAIQLLVDAGGTNQQDLDDALITAARTGTVAILRALLDAGADVHACDGAALVDAAVGGHADVVAALLDAGAQRKNIALCEAAEAGHVEVARVLLDRGACAWFEASTPLRRAAMYGRRHVAQLLVERGASLDALPPALRDKAERGLPVARATDADCVVMREPIAPGASYRVCTSNVPHTVGDSFAVDAYADTCPMCKKPLCESIFINK